MPALLQANQRLAAGPQAICQRRRDRRRTIRTHASANGRADNPLVSLAVGAMTEGLRLAGVGADDYRAATTAATSPARAGGRALRRGDVAGLLRTLRRDYTENSYFVTGVLDNAEIYSPDCLFADPTISFRGRDLYVRNLSLLVPFLEEPRIELKSLRQLPAEGRQQRRWRWQWQWPGLLGAGPNSRRSESSGSESSGSSRNSSSGRNSNSSSRGAAESSQLFAEWRLSCYVRLPWAPFVEVNGTTTYTLNGEENQIVSHVEAWDISPTQALLLLLKPSERAAWRPRRQAQQQTEQRAQQRARQRG
ncbi:hypothetical protein C2E21_5369 [Chlorella sorokiniana]|uniref:Uncharacterized protein n=1 Tax=Chlorella sorokiniana TaxID=3076 RepID=A0A2P6TP04_CHLSO|nr:hypothetical protein C2E21_5369 [Chlorella sorokiniana]|eukprot:PRW51066.1 hypothetical protein C2E21_5369 [Chlorella sorokiniana]